MPAATRQRHNRRGHTGRAAAMADHDDPVAGRGLVLPVGPDTPSVRVRGRRGSGRPVAVAAGKRRGRTAPPAAAAIPARGRGQHPEHSVHRIPGAHRVTPARRAPVRDLRQRVERAGRYVRPAGEPQSVPPTPAQRVRAGRRAGDRRRFRGPRPFDRRRRRQTPATVRPQTAPRTGPPRRPVPVRVPVRGPHVPSGLVGVVRVVAVRQVRAPVAHHRHAGRPQREIVRLLVVRVAVLRVRAAVPGRTRVPGTGYRHP